jgi:hypothetical protein
MPEREFTPTPSENPTQVVLSIEEWNEIEDSVIALHAVLVTGVSDENLELLKAVYIRLAFALRPIRERITGN